MNPSAHKLAIHRFVVSNPSWHISRLKKRLNDVLDDPMPALGFVPDAFELDTANKTVRLVEVDGSSYVNAKKLQTICEFWFELDCRGWFCELHILQLFTKKVSVLTDDDLSEHWYENLYGRLNGSKI